MKPSTWLALASAVGIFVGGCTPASRLGRMPAAVEPAKVIPLSPYLKSLPTVPVEVAGKRLSFLFDTAGGATLFTPAVAAAAGCTPFGRVTVFRHDGTRIDVPRCGSMVLDVAGFPFRAEAGVFDLMALLPPGAPELGGIVSLQTLGLRPYTLDLAGMTLTLESPASLAARVSGLREVQVRSATQGGGAGFDLFLKVDAPRGDLWLEIDSGNSVGLILSPHSLAQLGVDRPQDPSQTVPVTLQIGGFGSYSAPAIVKDTIYDGLLDARFLTAHRLTVDPASLRAWLAAAG